MSQHVEKNREQTWEKDWNIYRKIAGFCAVLSMPIAWANQLLGLMAIGFDSEAMANPLKAIAIANPRLAQLGWVCDVFGFYLLLLPGMFALRHWFSRRSPLCTDLLLVLGVGYCLVGATGAGFLAGADTWLIRAYQAEPASQQLIATIFQALRDGVFYGVWQFVSMSMLVVWLIGTGVFLRKEKPIAGMFAIGLGAVSALVPLAGIINIPALGMSIFLYFLGLPLFFLWLGVVLLKGNVKVAKTSG